MDNTYEGASVDESGREMMKIMLKEMDMVTGTGGREHR